MHVSTTHHHEYDLVNLEPPRDPLDELDRLALRSSPAPESAQANALWLEPAGAPRVVEYSTLIELRECWKRLDDPQNSWQLTVVLLLAANFQGHLPGLIRRQHPALRLLISSPTGRLPGLTTIGDLALHSASLGWHLISFHRDASEAVSGALQPMTWSERCVLFYPAGSGDVTIPQRTEQCGNWERRWM